MKKIKIHKASCFDENEIDSIKIIINTSLKNVDCLNSDINVFEENLKIFKNDAKLLFDVICEHLPNGTIEQFFTLLLQERAVWFNAPWNKLNKNKDGVCEKNNTK